MYTNFVFWIFSFYPEMFRVVSGIVDLKKPEFATDVVDIIIHDGYSQNEGWKDDIALLRVNNHNNRINNFLGS